MFTALAVLSESVGARLREAGIKGGVVGIHVRDSGLFSFERQRKLKLYTDINDEILNEAYSLFRESCSWEKPVRSIGVRVSDIVQADVPVQLDIFSNESQRDKRHKLDMALDSIRNRFGQKAVVRGTELVDRTLCAVSPKTDNVIFPTAYFR